MEIPQRRHRIGPTNILLVDDDEGDVILIGEALNSGAEDLNLFVARDGVEAMECLRQEGQFAQVPRPDLIFLDLNMPRKNGYEVLAEIRRDPSLRLIPIVVLTTSSMERDVLESYRLKANCYVTKPAAFEQLVEVMSSIRNFWLNVVTLPPTYVYLR